MVVVSLVAAAVVSAVLVVAAVAKLRDPDGLVAALPGLGVSDRFAPVIGPLLPFVEVALAVGLWVPATRRIAGAGAGALMGVFLVVVSVALLRGRRVRCACFGSLSAAELSWTAAGRNLVLAGLGAVVAVQPATWGDAARRVEGGTTTLVLIGVVGLLALALGVLARFQFELFRRYGDVLNRLEALGSVPVTTEADDGLIGPGAEAPAVAVGELDRGPFELASLWHGRRAVLVFTNPGCQACRAVMPRLSEFAERHRDVAVAVLSPHSARRTRDLFPDAPVHWLVDRKQAAFEAFGVHRTPIAVLVDAEGEVVETAKGSAQVAALLDEVALTTLTLDDVDLLDNDGRAVRVADVLGHDGSLVFWNPDCGFCQELQPRLAELPAEAIDRAVAIVSGLPRPGAGPGDGWRVLFDPDRFAARVAESPGTPSLVHLSGGQPLGAAAIGGDAVLEALAADGADRRGSGGVDGAALRSEGRR